MSILVTLLALGFVIFVHELGHLIAAKKANVGVSEFAVGMGPKVASFNYNGTMYSLRALPFGGFIKAKGLDDLDDCPVEEDYREKSVLSRAIILAAGSTMNIILGYIVFVTITLIVGTHQLTPNIHAVLPNSPAESSGILVGDEIKKINNEPISNVETDVIQLIKASNGDPIEFEILRDGTPSTVTMSAQLNSQGVHMIGVSFKTTYEKIGFFSALKEGGRKTVFTISQSFQGIKMLISGQANIKELAGPVGIIQMASSQVQSSLVGFFGLMAFISISLGVINLCPFPVLDGGHLLFLLIEAFRGRPLNKTAEATINNVAAACLVGLMVFIVFNDIMSWDERVSIIQEMSQ